MKIPPQRYLIAIYFWIMAVVVTLTIYTGVFITRVFQLLLRQNDNGRRIHGFASRWSQLLLGLTPGWKVSVQGHEHLPKDDQPMVIIANHESMADIWAMYFLGVQFRWLSKQSVFNIPMVGSSMRWAGYVPIERGNRTSHSKAMQLSALRLEQGLSMFFFPEGTRSNAERLKPFKSGAFRLAQQHQVPVLPVAIIGTRDLLPKGSGLPGSAHIHVHVLSPFRIGPDEDLDAVSERSRQLIQDEVDRMRRSASSK